MEWAGVARRAVEFGEGFGGEDGWVRWFDPVMFVWGEGCFLEEKTRQTSLLSLANGTHARTLMCFACVDSDDLIKLERR